MAIVDGLILLGASGGSASHQPPSVHLISADTDGQASGGSDPAISADGTRIAYYSDASDIVMGDTNGVGDVFIYDTATDTTALVSKDPAGAPSNGRSYGPAISADGTKVAYVSFASNLVVGDTNGLVDVYLYDTETGTTSFVSADIPRYVDLYGPTWLGQVSIAGDGSKIAYVSGDSGAGDCEDPGQIYLYDTATATSTLIAGDYQTFKPSVNGDGTKIAYQGGCQWYLFYGRAVAQVWLYDTTTATRTPISTDAEGLRSVKGGFEPSISADGIRIAYISMPIEPIPDTCCGPRDVLVYDSITRTTIQITTELREGVYWERTTGVSISDDGNAITYESNVSDLVVGDTKGHDDVFRYEMSTGTTTLITVSNEGGPANGNSGGVSINGDGTTIAYHSDGSDLVIGDTNDLTDVFVASVNLNDAPPTVVGFATSVPEDMPIDTRIGNVTASDVDGDLLTFKLTAGNADELFSIDSTGAVILVGSLDYETTVQHAVVVTVSDGTHAVDASFTVDVTDVGGPLDVVVDAAANPFDDDDGSIFENDIEWLAAAGITKGCDTRLFCPKDKVTRGQMAAFLNRALNLPPTTTDFFTDDNGTLFENDINRLAAAGITKGCSTDAYCADQFVTRGQMAAFLNRGLNLPSTTTDFFVDDDGTLFENDINRLAAADITKGCSTDAYCADQFVTRGQIAAFLRRALSK